MIAARPQTANTPPKVGYIYMTVGLICAAAPPLLIFHQWRWLGWLLLGIVVVWLFTQLRTRFAHHMLLLSGSLALLGIIPINTDIDYTHMLTMGGVLMGTIVLPFLISRYFLREQVISFPFRHGRKWYRREIGYIFFAGVVSYLLVPFYLADTGSYLNWSVTLDPSHVVRLFLGTNALGIWDELFFVGICLALLRQHLPFVWANIAQAVLWTTFLYELGFRGWGTALIFFFALTQGYIFKKSNSLLYIITVHLTIDFVLFLTLIHLHEPQYLRIFITSPF